MTFTANLTQAQVDDAEIRGIPPYVDKFPSFDGTNSHFCKRKYITLTITEKPTAVQKCKAQTTWRLLWANVIKWIRSQGWTWRGIIGSILFVLWGSVSVA